MSRAKRDPEKDAFWRLVVDEYQRSGLTVREFCRKEGVSEPSFHYWKRVLKERDREVHAATNNRSSKRASRKRLTSRNRKKQTSVGPTSFVPVEVVTSTIPPSPQLAIRTPAGFIIDLPPTVDIGRLGQVLEVLAMQPPSSLPSGERDAS